MLDLYYWPTSNGRKITIMLHEVELPYNIIPVNFKIGEQYEPGFLEINPNNKIPAIVDHDPPGGGAPLAIFESVAILIYLAEKTGRFLSGDLRGRSTTIQWVMWQMAGLGPMLGQHGHFALYAAEKIPYAIERYTNECNRLYGVMNKRLADRPFLAGDYSIADIASVGWTRSYQNQGQDLEEFPNLKRWFETIMARPAVIAGIEVGRAERERAASLADDKEAQKVLFGQRARQ